VYLIFHAITLIFDLLTFNDCSLSTVRWSNPVPNLSVIEREAKVFWWRLHQILLPSLRGDQDHRLTQCSLGPQQYSYQTGSWSVQPFLHNEAELSRVTEWQTDRHTPRTSVTLVQMQSTQPKKLWRNYCIKACATGLLGEQTKDDQNSSELKYNSLQLLRLYATLDCVGTVSVTKWWQLSCDLNDASKKSATGCLRSANRLKPNADKTALCTLGFVNEWRGRHLWSSVRKI